MQSARIMSTGATRRFDNQKAIDLQLQMANKKANIFYPIFAHESIKFAIAERSKSLQVQDFRTASI